MNISTFGAGYVGLVTGVCFAELGNTVLCYDIDEKKIAMLQKGNLPIFEPGLQELVGQNVRAGRLRFTTNPEEAGTFGTLHFIAVGTPSQDDGQANLSYVFAAAETIGRFLVKDRTIVVTKSTVPVGTGKRVHEIIAAELTKRNHQYSFAVVSNPEFLREGNAIQDFLEPDRIVVGAAEDWARKSMEALYFPLTRNGHQLFSVTRESAEMSKYAANAMLATKISFINQIANLCENVGADVEDVRTIIAADHRIGPHFLSPGVGYGGSCFPKDVQALSMLADAAGCPANLIRVVGAVNEEQKKRFATTVLRALGEEIRGTPIAVWGLSFKPNTDDMRAAPSLTIIEALLERGASMTAYDPVAEKQARLHLGDRITYADDMYASLIGAQALVIITDWPQFKEPDFPRMRSLMAKPLIVDGRNIYEPSRMREMGFTYLSVGRSAVNSELGI